MTNKMIKTNAHRINEVNAFATFPMYYVQGKCSYCGSLSPEALVRALKSGIGISWADRKYGYPHKLYLDTSFEGSIKFYTTHLRDATEEEIKFIGKYSGIIFKFDVKTEGDLQWFPYVEEENKELNLPKRNFIYSNNETGKLYNLVKVILDCTNSRDGQQLAIYSPIENPKVEYGRELTEFNEKFTLIEKQHAD